MLGHLSAIPRSSGKLCSSRFMIWSCDITAREKRGKKNLIYPGYFDALEAYRQALEFLLMYICRCYPAVGYSILVLSYGWWTYKRYVRLRLCMSLLLCKGGKLSINLIRALRWPLKARKDQSKDIQNSSAWSREAVLFWTVSLLIPAWGSWSPLSMLF